ncbi:MAG: N-acetylmuramoyl-L-alanine amidase [Fimbriimonadaceae bacterium]|nr:MAG: N-acetylmuramoyl-L-alanine amidase [Fimbriimonadaceae bacterium]
MRRILAWLLPWMAVFAVAQGPSLTVEYTHRGEIVDAGFRESETTFVAPSMVRRFGWNIDVRNGVAAISGEGRNFSVPVRERDGRGYVPLEEAVRYMGGTVETDPETGRVSVLGSIRNIEAIPEGARVDSTLAVGARAFRLADPDRLVVDFTGARLEARLVSDLPAGWRAAQFTPNVVRFVIESPVMATLPVPSLQPSRSFQIGLVPKPNATQEKPAVVIATLSRPVLEPGADGGLTVRIPVTGPLTKGPSAVFQDPRTIQLLVPQSSTEAVGDQEVGSAKGVKGLAVSDDQRGQVSMLFSLDRPLAFWLETVSGEIRLRLTPPRGSGGLTGKVVVVDAGHGGRDSGANHGGVMEKTVALQTAQRLANELSKAGASVVMTRADDTFVNLSERPEIANRARADLFVSVHYNSNTVANSRSGTIVFYHKRDPQGMLLAECVRAAIAKKNRLPCMGIWSDQRIYQSGFAVLRGATMPAVLLELGFLNHATDRALSVRPDFQQDMAEAVVRGIKEYFGE